MRAWSPAPPRLSPRTKTRRILRPKGSPVTDTFCLPKTPEALIGPVLRTMNAASCDRRQLLKIRDCANGIDGKAHFAYHASLSLRSEFMLRRTFGDTNLEVSAIALGCWI